jgi:heme-degrading monooxygenase HmoA
VFVLHVKIEIKPGHGVVAEQVFAGPFKAAISAQPGFSGIQFLRPGDDGYYVQSIAFESQKLQQQWVATELHAKVWPAMEEHFAGYSLNIFNAVLRHAPQGFFPSENQDSNRSPVRLLCGVWGAGLRRHRHEKNSIFKQLRWKFLAAVDAQKLSAGVQKSRGRQDCRRRRCLHRGRQKRSHPGSADPEFNPSRIRRHRDLTCPL